MSGNQQQQRESQSKPQGEEAELEGRNKTYQDLLYTVQVRKFPLTSYGIHILIELQNAGCYPKQNVEFFKRHYYGKDTEFRRAIFYDAPLDKKFEKFLEKIYPPIELINK